MKNHEKVKKLNAVAAKLNDVAVIRASVAEEFIDDESVLESEDDAEIFSLKINGHEGYTHTKASEILDFLSGMITMKQLLEEKGALL